jgi:hypothetical protein
MALAIGAGVTALLPELGAIGREIASVVPKAGSVVDVLNKSKSYFRSMSKAEAAAVKDTGMLRGGRDGPSFFTDQKFRSGDGGARVADRLSLPARPEVQMEFRVLNSPSMARNGTRVEPAFGGRGGGREFMTEDPVEVEILNVQPY